MKHLWVVVEGMTQAEIDGLAETIDEYLTDRVISVAIGVEED